MKKNGFVRSCRKVFLSILMIHACFVARAQEDRMESPHPPPVPSPPYSASDPLNALPSMDIKYLKAIQDVQHSLAASNYLFGHVDDIPAFSENLRLAFEHSEQHIPELVHYTCSLSGSKAGGYGPPVRGSWKGKSIETEADEARFFELEGVDLVHPEEWQKLPFEFRKGVLEFLFYLDRAKTCMDLFIHPLVEYLGLDEDSHTDDIRELLMIPWNHRELKNWQAIRALGLADEKRLAYASRLASERLGWFFSQTTLSVPEDFRSCSITSCMGECVISGPGTDTIEGNKFCVIELGGDDLYRGHTASPLSIKQPLGIVIDLQGNDTYLCDDHYLVSGVLGLGLLMDLDGNDCYRTNKPGLASSVYGNSILYDLRGDDVYFSSAACSQACSYAGTSMLIDISGNDTYCGSSFSQGFGGTLGVAVFYDGRGTDSYNASMQEVPDKDSTVSFVQGAAKGRWAEATDGQSLAGGMGIFFDNGGVDSYKAGYFSQGASYFFSLGICSDSEGNDAYNATSHSQGYAAHYALAAFIEKAGDDSYNLESDPEKLTQVLGGGRDHSAGLFIDLKGDDSYHFGNRSAGIGDLNGMGMLADYSGKDVYLWNKNRINSGFPSLGKTIDQEPGLGLSFTVIPQKNQARGIFFDSNGDHNTKD